MNGNLPVPFLYDLAESLIYHRCRVEVSPRFQEESRTFAATLSQSERDPHCRELPPLFCIPGVNPFPHYLGVSSSLSWVGAILCAQ